MKAIDLIKVLLLVGTFTFTSCGSEEAVLTATTESTEEVAYELLDQIFDEELETVNDDASTVKEEEANDSVVDEEEEVGNIIDEETGEEEESEVESNNQEVVEEGGDTAEETGEQEDEATERISETASTTGTTAEDDTSPPLQTGPFVDLLGPQLLSLKMVDETHAEIEGHYTNDALSGKKVVGLYFSADWCGPCRQFTPELVAFYNRMNAKRGKQNQFEIVWISRCRDLDSFGQYFTHMNWLALPPDEAAGQRGQMLSEKYKVKGIPTVVLLDDLGNVITTDARNKIPQDKMGIGFPWRNPIVSLYTTIFPRSVRMMIKSQIVTIKDQLVHKAKLMIGLQKQAATS